MNCPNCGRLGYVSNDKLFCPNCSKGRPMNEEKPPIDRSVYRYAASRIVLRLVDENRQLRHGRRPGWITTALIPAIRLYYRRAPHRRRFR